MFNVKHAGEVVGTAATEGEAVKLLVAYVGKIRRAGAKVSREWNTQYKIRTADGVTLATVKKA